MRWVAIVVLVAGCDSLYSARGTTGPVAMIQYVQSNAIGDNATSNTIALALPSAASMGDVLVLSIGWSGPTAVKMITDTAGATFAIAHDIDRQATVAQALYVGVLAETTAHETVEVTMSGPSVGLDVRAIEYTNVDPDHPIDVDVGSGGLGSEIDTGAITTRHDGEVLVAGVGSESSVSMAGSGFESRATANGNIIEDAPAATAGDYNATASQPTGSWVIHAVALRPAPL